MQHNDLTYVQIFKYMVLEENKNRTSSQLQRYVLDVLKVKCKEKTTEVLKSSVRKYVYEFQVMLLFKDKTTLQTLLHKNDHLGENICIFLAGNFDIANMQNMPIFITKRNYLMDT